MAGHRGRRRLPRFPEVTVRAPAVVFVLVVVLLVAGSGCRTRPGETAPPGQGVVEAVVDGDTVVVRIGGHDEHVRLLGIDTPETVDPRKPVACYGHEASDHTHRLLPKGTTVRLERDVAARDAYGRLLAYVYRQADGLFVNLELARSGDAAVLVIAPNGAHADEIRAAVAAAKAGRIGLWGACSAFGAPLSG
jgi:micrococcal nuclease